ncbi:MAG TPA: TolC family outer membrane protein [Caulobacteraceae bacterium]
MFNTRRAALLAAVSSAGLLAAAGAAHAETLADAIALAYQTNPTLQEQRASQRALDETYVQARTGLRPTVDATASVSEREIRTAAGETQVDTDNNGIPDTTIPVPSFTSRTSASAGQIEVTQPIYTGGRVTSQISASEADVLAGREGLRQVEAGVLLNVVQAYVDVRRDQERLRIAQENVSVLNRQLEEARARFEVGEITRTDTAQAEARQAAARATLASAQAALAISRANYAAVVGQNPGELAPEPSLAPLLPATVDQAFERAQENNGAVRAAGFEERASSARVAAARAKRRPTVGLRGTLGYSAAEVNDVGNRFGDYDRDITGSVVASMPIFTGGLTNSQVRQASARNTADRIAIEGARRDVLQDVARAWNQLLGARANLVANQEQVNAAQIAFEGTREEAQVGLRTTLDVLNAEQELRNAQLALVTARRDEYVAAALVLAAMGDLEAPKLVPGVEAYDPAANFNRVKHSWGWVPWEYGVEMIDRVGAPPIGKAPENSPVAGEK